MSNRTGHRLCAHELIISFALQQHVCASKARLALPPLGKQRGKNVCPERHEQNSNLRLQVDVTEIRGLQNDQCRRLPSQTIVMETRNARCRGEGRSTTGRKPQQHWKQHATGINVSQTPEVAKSQFRSSPRAPASAAVPSMSSLPRRRLPYGSEKPNHKRSQHDEADDVAHEPVPPGGQHRLR